jgi:RNA polymerase sigma factor for flagellar operon FliA
MLLILLVYPLWASACLYLGVSLNENNNNMIAELTATAAPTRDELILEHLPQVRFIARRIHGRLPENVSMDDLISTGVLGLIAAVDRFDPTQGVKLKTYAEHKIRGAIMDSLRSADWAPRLQRKRARTIEQALASLEQRLQRQPNEDEIAKELGIEVEEYREWLSDSHGLTLGSLEAGSSSSEEGSRDMLQMIADDSESWPSQIMERSELEKLLARAIDRMPQTERTVLSLYYHEELTLREIAKVMDVHESRISQLKTQAILRLRTLLSKHWPVRGAKLAKA